MGFRWVVCFLKQVPQFTFKVQVKLVNPSCCFHEEVRQHSNLLSSSSANDVISQLLIF